MNQTLATTPRDYDLALLLTPSRLVLVVANGTGIAPKLAIPLAAGVEPALVRKLVGQALRPHRPRRLLLSVAAGIDHERLLDPVSDTACAFAGHSGAQLVWLPDLVALAGAMRETPPSLGERLAGRLRTLAERARETEIASRRV